SQRRHSRRARRRGYRGAAQCSLRSTRSQRSPAAAKTELLQSRGRRCEPRLGKGLPVLNRVEVPNDAGDCGSDDLVKRVYEWLGADRRREITAVAKGYGQGHVCIHVHMDLRPDDGLDLRLGDYCARFDLYTGLGTELADGDSFLIGHVDL